MCEKEKESRKCTKWKRVQFIVLIAFKWQLAVIVFFFFFFRSLSWRWVEEISFLLIINGTLIIMGNCSRDFVLYLKLIVAICDNECKQLRILNDALS